MNKERRLGRGLAALLGEDTEPVSVSEVAAAEPRVLRIHRPDDDSHDDAELSLPPAAHQTPGSAAGNSPSMAPAPHTSPALPSGNAAG